jgi:hypothetical protein
MTEVVLSSLHSTLSRILAKPTPDDLWQLQGDLLALGGEAAERARAVAGEFYRCLRSLESKIASRSASRWGAVLETAAVTSVGLQEMIAEQTDPLKRLLSSGITGLLEVAAATKNVRAWEVEASLMYYDVAWYLYGELWAVSAATRPGLSSEERQALVERLLKPLLDRDVNDAARSALLVWLFQVTLAARMWPLLAAGDPVSASA